MNTFWERNCEDSPNAGDHNFDSPTNHKFVEEEGNLRNKKKWICVWVVLVHANCNGPERVIPTPYKPSFRLVESPNCRKGHIFFQFGINTLK